MDGHRERTAALARSHHRGINKTKAEVREEFRPQWRALQAHQESERKAFDALETSFFGRASNIAKTVRLSSKLIEQDKTDVITRTFRILTNAGERKAYFEQAQKLAQETLQRHQAERVHEATKSLKGAHSEKLAANRAIFEGKHETLLQAQAEQRNQLQDAWKGRTKERATVLDALSETVAKAKFDLSPRERSLFDAYMRNDFSVARKRPAPEQDNYSKRDEDRER